jgi:hypothetical protein
LGGGGSGRVGEREQKEAVSIVRWGADGGANVIHAPSREGNPRV